mmetsp:Transcript_3172/g.6559  ORF Transcript_3172/g.6559 Transcript_3172/m.6559 type:complete len:288 (-) Transcript_3172:28-891(-)
MAALLLMLKDLFKEAYIVNCQLEKDPPTDEDLATLEDLDAEEIIENLKNLLTELLDFKRELKSSDKAELYTRSEQFENMLQKLEGDIRTHIRLEHQLKLHIDSLNAKQIEMQKSKENSEKSVDELRQLMAHKDSEILRLKAELDKADSGSQTRTEDASVDRSYVRRNKSTGRVKLENEVIRLKGLLDEKAKEVLKLKRFYTSHSNLGSCSELRNKSAEKKQSSERSQKTERRILRKNIDPTLHSYSGLENVSNIGALQRALLKKASRVSSIVKASQRPTHYRCKSDV